MKKSVTKIQNKLNYVTAMLRGIVFPRRTLYMMRCTVNLLWEESWISIKLAYT